MSLRPVPPCQRARISSPSCCLPHFPNKVTGLQSQRGSGSKQGGHPAPASLGTFWRPRELSFHCSPLSLMTGVAPECHQCWPVTQPLGTNGSSRGGGTITDGLMVRAVRDAEGHRGGVPGETVAEPLKIPLRLPDPALCLGSSQGLSLSPALTQVRAQNFVPQMPHCSPRLGTGPAPSPR